MDETLKMATRLHSLPLTASECSDILKRGGLGRLAVSSGALPAIYSAFFSVLDDHVVVRLSPTWALAKEADRAVVAFNVDHAGEAEAWTVMVQGVAQLVSDPASVARLRSLPLPSWSEDPDDDVFLSVEPTKLTGARYSA